MEGGTRVRMKGSPSQYDTSSTCRLTDLSVQREDKHKLMLVVFMENRVYTTVVKAGFAEELQPIT